MELKEVNDQGRMLLLIVDPKYRVTPEIREDFNSLIGAVVIEEVVRAIRKSEYIGDQLRSLDYSLIRKQKFIQYNTKGDLVCESEYNNINDGDQSPVSFTLERNPELAIHCADKDWFKPIAAIKREIRLFGEGFSLELLNKYCELIAFLKSDIELIKRNLPVIEVTTVDRVLSGNIEVLDIRIVVKTKTEYDEVRMVGHIDEDEESVADKIKNL